MKHLVRLMIMSSLALAVVVVACGGGGDGTPPDEDPDPNLPGTFVPAQERGHFNRTFNPDREPLPFCDGVATADETGASSVSIATPLAGEQNDCYSSNPPSSGWHLGVQRNVEVAPGAAINIPPDPDVYPADIEIPREAIPHIQEHAGVFVGYRCSSDACEQVVETLRTAVRLQLDAGKRVVMAPDSDLEDETIALASWTRIDKFLADDFSEGRVRAFIETHSCRFDPEGFCEGS